MTSSSLRAFIGILALASVSLSTASAQEDIDPVGFVNYGAAPELWRPASVPEPGVGPTGDLAIDLSILSVPGRSGLGYDVRFRYASGIRFNQPSSWIGTGWSFDPGSIVRDVQGVAIENGLDYDLYGVDFIGADNSYQPDHYYVTMPGGSTGMVESQSGRGWPRSTFRLTEWKPWAVEANWSSGPVVVEDGDTGRDYSTLSHYGSGTSVSDEEDYTGWVITDDTGTRYVFEEPTLATYKGQAASGSDWITQVYVGAWRLRAILGPNYEGDSIPTGDEPGGWVRLDYDDIETVLSDGRGNYWCGDREFGPLDGGRIEQNTYLESITTPTHIAYFRTESRGQGVGSEARNNCGLQKRLKQIDLETRAGTSVKSIDLAASHRFESPLMGEGGPVYYDRLALDGISFEDGGGVAQPGYLFTYHEFPGGYTQFWDKIDPFGFYDTSGIRTRGFSQSSSDSKVWSMETISYPTGGADTFDYESDQIDIAAAGYQVNSDQQRQGGVRVTSVARSSGVGASEVTSYSYGDGRNTGKPSWQWSFEEGGLPMDNRRPFFFPSMRGRGAVYYDSVTRWNSDGSKVRTSYATPDTHPGIVRTLQWVGYEPSLNGSRLAFTLIQGNQDANWGRPILREYIPAGSDVPVREEAWEPELPTSTLANAWPQGGGVMVEQAYPTLTNAQESVEISGGNRVSTRTEYVGLVAGGHPGMTNAMNGKPRYVDVHHEDGRVRRSSYIYAYEKYPELYEAHRLSEIASVTVSERTPSGDDFTSEFYSAAATRYAAFTAEDDPDGPSSPTRVFGTRTTELFKPSGSFVWAAEEPSASTSAFSWWTTGTPTAEWEPAGSALAYNANGLPNRVVDGDGVRRRVSYTDAGYPTRVETYGGTVGIIPDTWSVSLVSTYQYSEGKGLLTKSTDETGAVTRYSYDGWGRLRKVFDSYTGADPLVEHAYDLSSVPNKVTTTTKSGAGTADGISVSFYDGLGRLVQTQRRRDDGKWDVSATIYRKYWGTGDDARLVRSVRPYAAATGGAYQSDPVGGARAFYGTGSNDTSVSPYQDVVYAVDGTGRAAQTNRPYGAGVGWAEVNQAYGAGADYDPTTTSEPVLRYAGTLDERGVETRTYADAWGHERFTVRAVGTEDEVRTETISDVLGRAVEVRHPNHFDMPPGSAAGDWVSTYAYDARGNVIEEESPDAGATRYAYDLHGRVRFSQTVVQENQGRFTFYRYYENGLSVPNVFGALSERGEMRYPSGTAAFDDLDPGAVYTGEDTIRKWDEVYRYGPFMYDDKPFYAPEGWACTNGAGRLCGQATKSSGKWQAELFAYDDRGRVAERRVRTEGVGNEWEHFAYTYDRQGRVLTEHVEVGGQHLWHHYEYDRQGRMRRVYATTTPSGTKPALADLEYAYNPDGSLAETRYRETSPGTFARVVPRTYDVRGRLTDIGDVDGAPTGSGAQPFAERLTYRSDSKVERADFLTPFSVIGSGLSGIEYPSSHPNSIGAGGPDHPRYQYRYGYDHLGRITAAWYHNVLGPGNEPYAQYFSVHGDRRQNQNDPSDPRIGYDAQGNILKLIRWSPHAAQRFYTDDDTGTTYEAYAGYADLLAYNYEPGTNRLSSVQEWEQDAIDGESATHGGSFEYDARGRLKKRRLPGGQATLRVDGYDLADRPTSVYEPLEGRQTRHQYGAHGWRVASRAASRITACDESEVMRCEDPNYAVRRYVRGGSGGLVGLFDGDGSVRHWALRGAGGTEGRLWPTAPVMLVQEGASLALLAADDSTAAAQLEWALDPAYLETEAGVMLTDTARTALYEAARPAVEAEWQRATAAGVEEKAAVQDEGALANFDVAGSKTYDAGRSGYEGSLYEAALAAGLSAEEAAAVAQAGGARLAEGSSSSAAEATLAGAAVPVMPLVQEERRYYVADHLGSVRAVFDQSGTVVEATDYYVFGLQMPGRVWRSDSETREGYTGHELDPETGLNYAGARYYDSALGRWHVIDPLWAQFPSLSPYNYAFNDPINWADPDGRDPCQYEGEGDSDGAYCIDEVVVESQIEFIELAAPLGSDNDEPIEWIDGEAFMGEPMLNTFPDIATGGAGKAISLWKGVRAASALKKTLPAWRSIRIDMTHILSGHTAGGARVSALKDLFPNHMNPVQIERAIRNAYRNVSKKVTTQGERVLVRGTTDDGMVIEMWVNRTTKTIETAYPKL